MEGVSNEAASFAGHQKLSNLCWVYDNNHITIDGHTSITYEDDVEARFQGYQWNVTRVEDANDLDEIARGFDNFQEEQERPTLIIVDSHIGYGAPNKQDTAEAHGEPARRRGGPGDEALLRLARGRGVPRPRRGAGSLRRGDGQARRRAAGEMGRAVRALQGRRARERGSPGGDAAPRVAGGLGRGAADLRARREGDGHPQGLEQGRERGGGEGSLAAWSARRT